MSTVEMTKTSAVLQAETVKKPRVHNENTKMQRQRTKGGQLWRKNCKNRGGKICFICDVFCNELSTLTVLKRKTAAQ